MAEGPSRCVHGRGWILSGVLHLQILTLTRNIRTIKRILLSNTLERREKEEEGGGGKERGEKEEERGEEEKERGEEEEGRRGGRRKRRRRRREGMTQRGERLQCSHGYTWVGYL